MSDDTHTGRDLDVGLARLMGFDYAQTSDEMSDEPLYRVVGPDGQPLTDSRWWVSREFAHRAIPEYHRSLDALFAPGGPVEYAAKKGLGSPVVTSGMADGVLYLAVSVGAGPIHVAVGVGQLAEAITTVLHEAFMKEQGQ